MRKINDWKKLRCFLAITIAFVMIIGQIGFSTNVYAMDDQTNIEQEENFEPTISQDDTDECICVTRCADDVVDNNCPVCLADITQCVVELEKMDMATAPLALGNEAEVYVNCTSGNIGTGTEADPTSFEKAMGLVADNGTIYAMKPTSGNEPITFNSDITIDGRGITLKPYMGSNSSQHPERSLIGVRSGANVTISNMTFDGGAYSGYDLLYVDDGTLTLNENTVVQNYQNNANGAAIGGYTGTVITLNGAKVINNKTGWKSTAHGGGITTNGILNIKGTTEITGNYLYDHATETVDVMVGSDGTVNLEGTAKVGILAFQASKGVNQVINVLSSLQNDINVHKHAHTSNFGGMLLDNLGSGELIAEGANGYVLTDSDIAHLKVIAGSAGYYTAKNPSGQAVVSFDVLIGAYPTIVNGKIYINEDLLPAASLSGKLKAPCYSTANITVEGNPGYRYKEGSFIVEDYSELDLSTEANLTRVSGENKFTMTMLKGKPNNTMFVSAEFEEKTAQTVSDPSHQNGSNFVYTVMADEVDGVDLTMTNSTVFVTGDTAPDPLVSFELANPNDGIIKLDGTKIIPLKVGTTIINAVAEETDSHKALAQQITVNVVKPLSVTLKSQNYSKDTGITFIPKYVDGSHAPYTINNNTRALGLRKVGSTDLTIIPTTSWNWGVPYTQAFTGLTPKAEYEIVLTANDNQSPATTAKAILRFQTPPANANVDTGAIEGTITGSGSMTVRVERGNTIIASKTGLSNGDKFRFLNLPNGEYNLVAMNDNGETVTKMATINKGETRTIDVALISQKESTVQIKEDALPVAVDKIQDLFDTDTYNGDQDAIDAVAGGGNIEIRLTADRAKAEEIAAIEAIMQKQKMALKIDLRVDMLIKPNGGVTIAKNLEEVDGLLTIAIPLSSDIVGKKNYHVYRYHKGQPEELQLIDKEATPVEGSFFIDGRYAYIYSQKFSAYAITYEAGSNTSGGGSANYYDITLKSNEGGRFEPNEAVITVLSGEDVTVKMIPDAGYRVGDVKVDGKSVGWGKEYTFKEVRSDYTLTVIFEKIPQDENAATEKPDDTKITNPQTGDNYANAWLGFAFLFAVLGTAMLWLNRRNRKQEEK